MVEVGSGDLLGLGWFGDGMSHESVGLSQVDVGFGWALEVGRSQEVGVSQPGAGVVGLNDWSRVVGLDDWSRGVENAEGGGEFDVLRGGGTLSL